jgi:hypothetical protein
MKTTRKRREGFASDRFEPPGKPFRGTPVSDLDRLKQQLLRPLLDERTAAGLHTPLRRAANEAAALAWLTPFPLLVFPELFEEKAREARLRTLRQSLIRRRSRALLPEEAA